MTLSPVTRKFILHWGEMGTRWGVNRTVAQIHALLYISPEPLNAEQIAETLEVARSNVSNSLRELQSWRLIHVTHRLGDRRDHFSTHSDVWEMFRIVLDERKEREVDPTLALLRECAQEAGTRGETAHTRQRISAMLEFFESMDTWYATIRGWPASAIARMVRMKDKVRKVLGIG